MPTPFVPMWRRIADDIRRQIAAGELRPGDKIPSTYQLADQYDVSTGVVRHAVIVLTAEGVLTGHQGRGVYVAENPPAGQ